MANIVDKYITLNPYYRDGRWIEGSDFKGFVLHSVGVGQPSPYVFFNRWNNPNYTYAGINGFIGEDEILITAPCLETPGKVKRMPHGGKAYSNNHYIGFEMCEPKQIKYTSGAKFNCSDIKAARAYVTKTYNNAVELFAKLCKFHNKNPLATGVIYSHNELGRLGIGSNHVDPEHLWSGLGMPYTMNGFRQDVYNKMNNISETTKELYRVRKDKDDAKTQKGAFTNLEAAKELADECIGYKVFDINGKMVYEGAKEATVMSLEQFIELMAEYRKVLQDNDSGNWSKDAREWAIENKLIQGNGTSINGEPNYMWQDMLTREQFVAVLHRFAKLIDRA